jgi:hypothetical protein
MNFIAGNQAITTDWVEMHFRLSNPGFFACPEAVKFHEPGIDQTGTKRSISNGKASPRIQVPGRDRVHVNKTVYKRIGNGNYFYTDMYRIWHRNRDYGVMFANSRDDHKIPFNDLQIQVRNNKLYEQGWLDDLKEITSGIESKFNNFTRLDIAVDGGKWLQLEQLWRTKQLYKTGRASVNSHCNNQGVVNGFYIGMSKSKKRLKIYNKSKELDKSNKLYIKRFWKLHGINDDETVERLELTIRNEEMKKYSDIDWQRLDDTKHLASIMKSHMSKFCDFRLPGTGVNVSRFPKVELIAWDSFTAEMLPKDTTRPTTEIWSAKVTIKKLFEIHLKTQNQLWFDCAYEIAINSDLTDYFSKMQPMWTDNFNTKIGYNREGIVSDSWVTRFQSYDVNEQVNIFDHDAEKLPDVQSEFISKN